MSLALAEASVAVVVVEDPRAVALPLTATSGLEEEEEEVVVVVDMAVVEEVAVLAMEAHPSMVATAADTPTVVEVTEVVAGDGEEDFLNLSTSVSLCNPSLFSPRLLPSPQSPETPIKKSAIKFRSAILSVDVGLCAALIWSPLHVSFDHTPELLMVYCKALVLSYVFIVERVMSSFTPWIFPSYSPQNRAFVIINGSIHIFFLLLELEGPPTIIHFPEHEQTFFLSIYSCLSSFRDTQTSFHGFYCDTQSDNPLHYILASRDVSTVLEHRTTL